MSTSLQRRHNAVRPGHDDGWAYVRPEASTHGSDRRLGTIRLMCRSMPCACGQQNATPTQSRSAAYHSTRSERDARPCRVAPRHPRRQSPTRQSRMGADDWCSAARPRPSAPTLDHRTALSSEVVAQAHASVPTPERGSRSHGAVVATAAVRWFAAPDTKSKGPLPLTTLTAACFRPSQANEIARYRLKSAAVADEYRPRSRPGHPRSPRSCKGSRG